MEETLGLTAWSWQYIVFPLIGAVWYLLNHRFKSQDKKIDSLREQVEVQNQQIHALNLCLGDYVKLVKFDKEIDTLHKCNAAMNNNFRADIKEVRADVKHANDRIDTKADKT